MKVSTWWNEDRKRNGVFRDQNKLCSIEHKMSKAWNLSHSSFLPLTRTYVRYYNSLRKASYERKLECESKFRLAEEDSGEAEFTPAQKPNEAATSRCKENPQALRLYQPTQGWKVNTRKALYSGLSAVRLYARPTRRSIRGGSLAWKPRQGAPLSRAPWIKFSARGCVIANEMVALHNMLRYTEQVPDCRPVQKVR